MILSSPEAQALARMEQPVEYRPVPRAPWWRVTAALLVAAAGLMVVAEGCVRIAESLRDSGTYLSMPMEFYPRFQPADGEMYRPRPGQQPGYVVNSMGFRGGEVPPRAEGEFRVLALGDSITQGWLLHEHEAWPAILEKHLAPTIPGVRVVNMGRVTTSSHGTRADVEKYAGGLEPDALVISVGWFNDWQPFHTHLEMTEREIIRDGFYNRRIAEVRSPFMGSALYRWWMFHHTSREMQRAYWVDQELRANGFYGADAAGRTRRVPEAEFRENLRVMCDWARSRGLPVLFTTPRVHPAAEQTAPIIATYAAIIAEEAAACGAILVPTREALLAAQQEKGADALWVGDHVHPTPRGQAVIAAAIAGALAPLHRPARTE